VRDTDSTGVFAIDPVVERLARAHHDPSREPTDSLNGQTVQNRSSTLNSCLVA
jgi:hypothetical protein